jgi:dolichol-phosphate mannosyltransferase
MSQQSRRVLITGASGFVGANLARRAIQDGHEVHLLLRAAHDDWRLRNLSDSLVTHTVDLKERRAVQRAVTAIRPHWVFHLAAYGAYATQTTLERMVGTNVWGCIHLLDACHDAGVEAFINAGSSSEYGHLDHAASEKDRLEPNSHYAITKATATHYCQFTARAKNVNAVTVRLYSVYGPFEAPGRLIPTLMVHGLHGQLPPLVAPQTVRDFVYVDDAVDAMLHLAASPAVPRGSVYNVCTGVQTSVGDIVEVARRLMNVPAEPAWGSMPQRAWDTSVWAGSPEALAAEAGWRASTGVAEGLQRTLQWLQAEPRRLQFYEERILGTHA